MMGNRAEPLYDGRRRAFTPVEHREKLGGGTCHHLRRRDGRRAPSVVAASSAFRNRRAYQHRLRRQLRRRPRPPRMLNRRIQLTVVNIDNGFGAACVASCINRL